MIRNKMPWIFAIAFAALLPIAFAQQQLTTTQRIFYIAVNALVIGIVLWILQSFLIPGKVENEKKATTLIIFLASALIAWLYGNSGYIWQVGPLSAVFNLYVIGNAILIGAAIYLVLGLFQIGKLDSPEGKAGYALLIFLVSVFFAVKIGPQWVWSQPMIAQFAGFLFGPDGILNPSPPAYRLWTFITSFVLIAFFFNNYLLKEGSKSQNVVNWLLAAILAMHLASSGVSMSTVVKIGEIIFVMIFAHALKGSVSEKYGMNWWVAILLVGWASYAMAPDMGIMSTIVGQGIPAVGMTILNIVKLILEIGLFVLLVKLLSNLFSRLEPGQETAPQNPGQNNEGHNNHDQDDHGHGGHRRPHGGTPENQGNHDRPGDRPVNSPRQANVQNRKQLTQSSSNELPVIDGEVIED